LSTSACILAGVRACTLSRRRLSFIRSEFCAAKCYPARCRER
jgi:hypothetical protein